MADACGMVSSCCTTFRSWQNSPFVRAPKRLFHCLCRPIRTKDSARTTRSYGFDFTRP